MFWFVLINLYSFEYKASRLFWYGIWKSRIEMACCYSVVRPKSILNIFLVNYLLIIVWITDEVFEVRNVFRKIKWFGDYMHWWEGIIRWDCYWCQHQISLHANIRRKFKDNIYDMSNKNVFGCIKVFIRNIIIIIIILLKDHLFSFTSGHQTDRTGPDHLY